MLTILLMLVKRGFQILLEKVEPFCAPNRSVVDITTKNSKSNSGSNETMQIAERSSLDFFKARDHSYSTICALKNG